MIIIPPPPAVEGVMCLVKWGSDKLVVYTTNKGIHYMGLYQVRLLLNFQIELRQRKSLCQYLSCPQSVCILTRSSAYYCIICRLHILVAKNLL